MGDGKNIYFITYYSVILSSAKCRTRRRTWEGLRPRKKCFRSWDEISPLCLAQYPPEENFVRRPLVDIKTWWKERERRGVEKGERGAFDYKQESWYKPALKGFKSYFTIHILHYPRLIWPACPLPKRERKKQLRARHIWESKDDSGRERKVEERRRYMWRKRDYAKI